MSAADRAEQPLGRMADPLGFEDARDSSGYELGPLSSWSPEQREHEQLRTRMNSRTASDEMGM